MQTRPFEDILFEAIFECHIDMYFYELLAVIIQEFKDETPDWEYTLENRELISEKFTFVSKVILHDQFQVKMNGHNVSDSERQYVLSEFRGHYNFAEAILLDTVTWSRVRFNVNELFGMDGYTFMQRAAASAFGYVNNKLLSETGNEFFKQNFPFKFKETKLLISLSIYGLFHSKTLFQAFRENKFKQMLDEHLKKYHLFILNENETVIPFNSELVVASKDGELEHGMSTDFFKNFDFDNNMKVTKGNFWRYVKRKKEEYSSSQIAPDYPPIVSFLNDPFVTLLKKGQIYLEYYKN